MVANGWSKDALCPTSGIDFFSEDQEEQKRAKALCFECPVRKLCLSEALNNGDRFGTWGGVDEVDIRKALSIDQNGKPAFRGNTLECPYCHSEDVVALESLRTKAHVECSACGLSWWTRKMSQTITIEDDENDDDLGDDI